MKPDKDLAVVLKPGHIYPATILRRVSDSQYLIQIMGREVIAASRLVFVGSAISVQVERTTPKVVLRMIDGNFNPKGQAASYAQKQGLMLDTFWQPVLAGLEHHGYQFSGQTPMHLNLLKQLAATLDETHLVPLDAYLNILATDPDFFTAVAGVLGFSAFAGTTGAVIDISDPDLVVNTLWLAWQNNMLANVKNELPIGYALPQKTLDLLSRVPLVLGRLNAKLAPNWALHGVLVPINQQLQLGFVQAGLKPAHSYPITRYQFGFTTSQQQQLRVNLRLLDKKLGLTLICDTGLLTQQVAGFEAPLKKLCASLGCTLLPVRMQVAPPRSLLQVMVN